MESLSYLSNAELGYVESLYEDYKADPATVDESWRRFFEGFELAKSKYGQNGSALAEAGAGISQEVFSKEHAVINLINAYRLRGHLFADINPIVPRPEFQPPITLQYFGLTEEDLEASFQAGQEIGLGTAKLRDIVDFLEQTYCRTIGAEYRYIRIPEIVNWLQEKMESRRNMPSLDSDYKQHTLDRLGRAKMFENFIHRKFPGQKRFSLEGGESIIPALDSLILHGSELGVEEFVIGMAHRGRLNILTNIMRKEPDNVFGEFKDKGVSDSIFDGDVKYHMGYSSDPTLANGKQVHLSMAPNPSHLEAVNPLVEGVVRARIDQHYQSDEKICPILIHGDASLAGQGVTYEVIQMSRLEGYATGGTVHYVINNQIGFTTDRWDGRSSTYCTDVGKTTLSPVFHVNGDDPEALVYVSQLAMEFRQKFKRDVFIDIICYRKYGHNEGDEPRFTQPKMYEAINKHPSPYDIYKEKLLKEGTITQDLVKKMEQHLNDYFHEELDQAVERDYELATAPRRHWEGIDFYDNTLQPEIPSTGVDLDTLRKLTDLISTLPEDFKPHRNIERLLKQRREMVEKTNELDWGMGEHLAYATLLQEGKQIRLSGQDSERGTFSHRHAVIKHQETDEAYYPLQHVAPDQAPFYVYNSPLSEFGVMGYEVGYAMASPYSLTIWEAQFGDFVNGAQVVIDQFLSSATTKWQRMCPLVLLLPHGYEGQGPEHSSARIERFLELAALNNMYITNCTTPANFFHALRRQLFEESRRPLVVFTPKSLLRSRECVSALEDFGPETKFQPVIDDPEVDPKKVTRVLLCSGKVYYDLLRNRDNFGKLDTAIIRLEQLYPLDHATIDELLTKKYSKAKGRYWVQEEPLNMGPWSFILRELRAFNLEEIGRKPSPSPATGSRRQHLSQQEYIVRKALDLAADAEVKI